MPPVRGRSRLVTRFFPENLRATGNFYELPRLPVVSHSDERSEFRDYPHIL